MFPQSNFIPSTSTPLQAVLVGGKMPVDTEYNLKFIDFNFLVAIINIFNVLFLIFLKKKMAQWWENGKEK